MALLYCDSFDHYATADLTEKNWSGVVQHTIVGGGRNGSCLQQAGNNTSALTRTLPSSHGTAIIGFAWQNAPGATGTYLIVQLRESGTNHVDLRMTTSNFLQVTRNGTVLATSVIPRTTGIWYYIEFKVVVHDTTGSYEVRVNGQTDLVATNQDTRNGGAGTINQFVFGNGDINNGNTFFDDLYFCDGADSGVSGAPNNDFLGDVVVQARFPSGNGNSSALVGSDGNSTDNYLLVDEATPNDDTDYVQGSSVGDKDTYAYSDLSMPSGDVYGVQISTHARKTDAGTREIVSVARTSGGTEQDGAAQALGTGYAYGISMRESKPGGTQWTVSDVNGAEFGAKVST